MKTDFLDLDEEGGFTRIQVDDSPSDFAWITYIESTVGSRGKGYGSQLLKKVCEEADKCQRALVLIITPGNGLSFNELLGWYQRNGFEPFKGDGLIRYPRSNQT